MRLRANSTRRTQRWFSIFFDLSIFFTKNYANPCFKDLTQLPGIPYRGPNSSFNAFLGFTLLDKRSVLSRELVTVLESEIDYGTFLCIFF